IYVYGDRARIKMRVGILIRLLGLPFLCIGGWMLFHFALGVAEYLHLATLEEWVEAIPGFAVLMFFTALFLAPGIMLSLFRLRIEMDRTENTVDEIKDFLFYKRTRRFRTDELNRVIARQATATHASGSMTGVGSPGGFTRNRKKFTLYPVEIEPREGKAITVAFADDKKEAKELASGIGEFMGIELNDRL
ncbi:MAG: hypothetical protein AAF420_10080, partial [Pseudomonadota bacterium]